MGARIKQREVYFFLPFFILYLGTLFLKNHPEIYSGWITHYLADLLCIPIVLQLSLWGLRFFKKNNQLYLSKSQIWIAFVYVSIVFEGILPYFKTKYTGDPLDALMYLLGTLFYLIIVQKKAS